MTANPHLSTETVLAGNPGAAVAAVLLHGRDQDPEFMLAVAQRLELDDEVAYVLPRAAGRSWYPGRFYDPMEDNEPWLGWSLEAVEAAVAQARGAGRRRPASPSSASRRAPASSPSTSPAGRSPTAPPPSSPAPCSGAGADRMPAGSLGRAADVLRDRRGRRLDPLDAVRDTVEAFQRAGARCELRVYHNQEHGVNDDEIVAVRTLLTDLLERTA